MNIKITKQKPDEVQRFFSAPLSFSQKVVVKKLLIVEQLLERMKSIGINRTKLAERMEVSPARVTSMLDGTNNFTIETLMRAAEAVESELALALSPKGQQVKWVTYSEEDIHASFLPSRQSQPAATTVFSMGAPTRDDEAHAA
jgi:plasmid maintenance system antidote protein VapI